MFELEDHVPIPNDVRGGATKRKYPFNEMRVGQSFFVPEKYRTRLVKAADAWKKRHPGWNYAVKAEREGVRLWRVA